MKNAIDETNRRRRLQEEFNRQNNITPTTIQKNITKGIESDLEAHRTANEIVGRTDETVYITQEYIQELEVEMLAAADDLDFEHRCNSRPHQPLKRLRWPTLVDR